MIKVNFISYLHPYKYSGGGEMDNRSILEYGLMKDIDIKLGFRRNGKLSKYLSPRYTLHEKPDFWILSDIYNCPEDKLSFKDGFIEHIIEKEKYIHLDNAYVDLCDKAALPCHANREKCLCTLSVKRADNLYSHSLVNIFLSPLHRDTVIKRLPSVGENRTMIARPLIHTEDFINHHKTRDIEYLYVGTISDYKGYTNIEKLYGDNKDFLFIGRNSTRRNIFGRHIPYIPHLELPAYYNRAVNFVHLPNWIEPMGRTVVEAALCGCKLITNNNVGALSFPFDISNPEEIAQSGDLFWEEILDIAISCSHRTIRYCS
jgi:glycosyltransferase involved in cell wall biosynthesis